MLHDSAPVPGGPGHTYTGAVDPVRAGDGTPGGPEHPRRGPVGLLLRGMAIGTSDLIPGVSGGTMALILGIYQELILTLGTLTRPAFVTALLRGAWRRAYRLANGRFLLLLGAGILTAIGALSPVLHHLLEHYPQHVAGFFFGLVAASTVLVGGRVRRWSVLAVVAFVVGAVGAFVLVGATPAQTPTTSLTLVLSGMLAICALVLPGVSGAFVLVLLGKYDTMLAAVSRLDLATIVPFGIGAAVGLLSFARVLSYLLRHHHDVTLAVLTGFLLGSLRKVWPFVDAAGSATLPWSTGSSGVAIAAAALALTGVALVAALERVGRARVS
ncbi:MAG: DUF368 domain-containing protein [Trueperaceae bacterium]